MNITLEKETIKQIIRHLQAIWRLLEKEVKNKLLS
jgi:hypothetical protein